MYSLSCDYVDNNELGLFSNYSKCSILKVVMSRVDFSYFKSMKIMETRHSWNCISNWGPASPAIRRHRLVSKAAMSHINWQAGVFTYRGPVTWNAPHLRRSTASRSRNIHRTIKLVIFLRCTLWCIPGQLSEAGEITIPIIIKWLSFWMQEICLKVENVAHLKSRWYWK